MKSTVILALTVLFAASAAFGDIPANRPKPKPPQVPSDGKAPSDPGYANMYINIGTADDGPTLIIEKSMLDKINAANTGMAASGSTGGLSMELSSVVAGVFLSLAMVFGGLWFVRSRRSVSRLAATSMLLAIGGAATIVFANVGPPKKFDINSTIFKDEVIGYTTISGKVKIKVVDRDTGFDIGLVMPKVKTKKADEE
jgi:ABC-type Na+ efflux pump permease subunit